jgi:transcriptional regulator with XRE-family HTH domain
MNKVDYLILDDIKLIRDLLHLSQEKFANNIGVSLSTVARWENNTMNISNDNIEKIYSYAFKNNIYINEIKAQLYFEDLNNENKKVLFHGAKNIIEGNIDIFHSRKNNDFGQGFYCGESFEQSALFVSGFENSSVYIIELNDSNLSSIEYKVNQEWMLTIAYFRGKLQEYENSKIVQSLIKKLENIDYIIAPIADNRMFQIIDSFINGEITDEQCKHCLAATNLGYQYIFKTQKSIEHIKIIERCYLCHNEKEMYQTKRLGDTKISDSKIKIARRQYRGKGQYIDEIL